MANSRKQRERKRGKRRENRHERRQQQHSGGGEWEAIRIPEGLDVFKPEKGETYHIDVVPYIVGDHNKNADAGDEYFELSYPVYNNLGVEDKRYIAIGELKGVPDPVAEHFASLRKQGAEWADMKDFKPKWRQLMLVFVHEQADKGLQLYEGAYGTLGELLDEELREQGESADWIEHFDDPDAGATLVVRFKAKNIGQANPWVLAAKLDFEERDGGFTANGDEKLAEEVLAKAAEINLEACLKVPDYDTLQRALDGVPVDQPSGSHYGGDVPEPEPEPEPKPKQKPKAKPKAKPKSAKDLGISKGDDVLYDGMQCMVIKVSRDGLKLTLMDGDDEVYQDVAPSKVQLVPDVDEVPEPEPEPEPEPAPAADVGDDDWDDDWDD